MAFKITKTIFCCLISGLLLYQTHSIKQQKQDIRSIHTTLYTVGSKVYDDNLATSKSSDDIKQKFELIKIAMIDIQTSLAPQAYHPESLETEIGFMQMEFSSLVKTMKAIDSKLDNIHNDTSDIYTLKKNVKSLTEELKNITDNLRIIESTLNNINNRVIGLWVNR